MNRRIILFLWANVVDGSGCTEIVIIPGVLEKKWCEFCIRHILVWLYKDPQETRDLF